MDGGGGVPIVMAGELDAALDKLDGFEYTMVLALWQLQVAKAARIWWQTMTKIR